MRYGTPEMVSYEVQPTSTQEHAKTLLGRHEYVERQQNT
jgi:hypothetical protein